MTDPPGPSSGVALVTGGSRGIGRAIVRALAREGQDVAFTFRSDAEAAARTAHEVEALGRRSFYRASDAADAEDAARFVEEARGRLGRLDVVVTNAGIAGSLGWSAADPADWRSMIAHHAVGPYATIRAAAPELGRTRGTAIVIASISGLLAHPEQIAYAAAKSAAISISRSLALALAPAVRVNAIAPGWVRSDMTRGLHDDPKGHAVIVRGIPLGRWGEPEDVAAAVLFLASEGARFITGETIVVDGGESIDWRMARDR